MKVKAIKFKDSINLTPDEMLKELVSQTFLNTVKLTVLEVVFTDILVKGQNKKASFEKIQEIIEKSEIDVVDDLIIKYAKMEIVWEED